jgi:hypothetical protein
MRKDTNPDRRSQTLPRMLFAFQSLKRAAVSSHERPWAFKTAHLLTLALPSVNPPPKQRGLDQLFRAMDNSLDLLIADARRAELSIGRGKTRQREIIINSFFDYSRIPSCAVLFLFNYRRLFDDHADPYGIRQQLFSIPNSEK